MDAATGAASDAASDAVAGATGAATNAASGAAAALGGAAGGLDPDALARKLFDPLVARIKAELRQDRERAGYLTDLRR